MKAKMTPGPWRVGCKHCDESNAIVAMAHLHVASVRRLNLENDTEREANSRAIACLPDLIAAANAVCNFPPTRRTLDNLRAILARIEGSEP